MAGGCLSRRVARRRSKSDAQYTRRRARAGSQRHCLITGHGASAGARCVAGYRPAVPHGRRDERNGRRSGPGSESGCVGVRHLQQPPVRRHGPRRRAQGELGRRRRRHLDGPRRERDGTGAARHHRERRYEPGRVCLLRTAPPRSRRRRLFRRPHQLSEHQSPRQPAAECPQRRRLEDLVRPHRRTPAAHAGERQTVACAGVHGDRRLRRRVHVHVAGVSDGRGEPRASGPQSSSATAGSISTTRPARTRRCSSTTCSRRDPCSASDSGSEARAGASLPGHSVPPRDVRVTAAWRTARVFGRRLDRTPGEGFSNGRHLEAAAGYISKGANPSRR